MLARAHFSEEQEEVLQRRHRGTKDSFFEIATF
jgi:hypothetical protein